MGSGSLTLGTTTLPLPSKDGYKRERVPKGSRFDLANGGAAFDYVAHKYVWTLSWRNLPSASRDILKTAYEVTSAQTFDDWDGTTGSVVTSLGGNMTETTINTCNGVRYNVDMVLEEC